VQLLSQTTKDTSYLCRPSAPASHPRNQKAWWSAGWLAGWLAGLCPLAAVWSWRGALRVVRCRVPFALLLVACRCSCSLPRCVLPSALGAWGAGFRCRFSLRYFNVTLMFALYTVSVGGWRGCPSARSLSRGGASWLVLAWFRPLSSLSFVRPPSPAWLPCRPRRPVGPPCLFVALVPWPPPPWPSVGPVGWACPPSSGLLARLVRRAWARGSWSFPPRLACACSVAPLPCPLAWPRPGPLVPAVVAWFGFSWLGFSARAGRFPAFSFVGVSRVRCSFFVCLVFSPGCRFRRWFWRLSLGRSFLLALCFGRRLGGRFRVVGRRLCVFAPLVWPVASPLSWRRCPPPAVWPVRGFCPRRRCGGGASWPLALSGFVVRAPSPPGGELWRPGLFPPSPSPAAALPLGAVSAPIRPSLLPLLRPRCPCSPPLGLGPLGGLGLALPVLGLALLVPALCPPLVRSVWSGVLALPCLGGPVVGLASLCARAWSGALWPWFARLPPPGQPPPSWAWSPRPARRGCRRRRRGRRAAPVRGRRWRWPLALGCLSPFFPCWLPALLCRRRSCLLGLVVRGCRLPRGPASRPALGGPGRPASRRSFSRLGFGGAGFVPVPRGGERPVRAWAAARAASPLI